MPDHRLRIDGSLFRDAHNREIILHGINIAADTKLPASPDLPSHVRDQFFDGDHVSFVNRPFALSEAHTHFSRLRRWGFNTIRYIFTWEALEHAGPGKYDEDFIQHTIDVLRVAKEYGFYVFMDPHQDVWSRFTGGSGAPMWTVYACGLDPEKLQVGEASIVQNTWDDPITFPKMTWATNYSRLAVQTIFTLFFSGKDFAPKCVIDGVNIQDYLQDHFVGACKHLAQRIREAGDLEGEVVIGYETVNEPNKGYFGHPNLMTIPEGQKLRKHTTPTGFQAMLTGAGRAVEVELWDFGGFGPHKVGTQLVDPKGTSAWLDPKSWDDSKYGWSRSPEWKLGECIWAQHGVWDTKTDEMLNATYFSKHPKTGVALDQEYWTNHDFMDFYKRYHNAIRDVWREAFLLMQPAPFEIPPEIKGTPEGDDPNMIFASHFYDGITLITKKWNRWWNIDVLGVLRGRYSSPAFAIRIGESAIRNCFKGQLAEVRNEGIQNMGVHPCLYTEIGIPYDMDDQYAYDTGDYSSQVAAIDANMFAVEGSRAQGMTWWCYAANNSHYWGDQWNGEDLSIYSADDKPLPGPAYIHENNSKLSLDRNSPSYSESASSERSPETPDSIKKALSVDNMEPGIKGAQGAQGYRAAEAYVRPVPVAVHGTIDAYGFDLKTCTFTLDLTSPSSTPPDYPTEVFLPEFHFPQGSPARTSVETSGGKWEMRIVEDVDGARQQVFKWWHGEGEQKLKVTGVKRARGKIEGVTKDAPEDSYLQAYWEMGKNCSVM
ncbi:glycoside hydrolase family 5 protein [Sphaerulina musiva SO2202]|uniref:Glycoside hydrolase family 5 protein n=1 Tax=Sphaerulina musiva (strain SO2202) TaxID=692275 RepID=M3BRQ7_SPHMS|nr:glycoside hydrolase family 5 protein [Sphaerulina musiva SO2202]EMF08798.1 glycoside hydrolase family 5 protein [Sphaerulina musiva SO2202]